MAGELNFFDLLQKITLVVSPVIMFVGSLLLLLSSGAYNS